MDGWIETSQNIFDRSQLRYNFDFECKSILCETHYVLKKACASFAPYSGISKCESSVIVGLVQLDL